MADIFYRVLVCQKNSCRHLHHFFINTVIFFQKYIGITMKNNMQNEYNNTEQTILLKNLVVKEIRQRIMTGQYGLGQRLSQNQLAQDLKTSRAPVHDALLTLRSEGLVQIIPQRGSFVFNPNPQEIIALFEASCAYELGALFSLMGKPLEKMLEDMEKYLAIMTSSSNNPQEWVKADRSFHASIVHATKNIHLIKSYTSINDCLTVLIYHRELSTERIDKSYQDHRNIIDGIRRNELEFVGKLLQSNNLGEDGTAYTAQR